MQSEVNAENYGPISKYVEWTFDREFFPGLNLKTSQEDDCEKAEGAEMWLKICVCACLRQIVAERSTRTYVWLKIQMSAFSSRWKALSLRNEADIWSLNIRSCWKCHHRKRERRNAEGGKEKKKGGKICCFDAAISPWGTAGWLGLAGAGIRSALQSVCNVPWDTIFSNPLPTIQDTLQEKK